MDRRSKHFAVLASVALQWRGRCFVGRSNGNCLIQAFANIAICLSVAIRTAT
jgi:hypothetical protein